MYWERTIGNKFQPLPAPTSPNSLPDPEPHPENHMPLWGLYDWAGSVPAQSYNPQRTICLFGDYMTGQEQSLIIK